MLERSPRFPIEIPIRYRRVSEPVWHEGVTENVSRSGVLFHSSFALKARAKVQLDFALPLEVLGHVAGRVTCRGCVVRVENGTGIRVAATISDYRFVSPGKAAR